MESSKMAHDVREIYRAEALLAALPADQGEFFVGYGVSDEAAKGWRSFMRRARSDGERPTARSVWEDPQDTNRRVLIDVTECDSSAEAIEALLDKLAENELARLEDGPPDLGFAAFSHPRSAPPATYFARGNLCFAVFSAGRTACELDPWLEKISEEMSRRPPDADESLSFEPSDKPAKPGARIPVRFSLKWKLGKDGWLRFTAKGGTIARGADDRTLVVVPAGVDKVELEGAAFESGRQPAIGTLIVPVKSAD